MKHCTRGSDPQNCFNKKVVEIRVISKGECDDIDCRHISSHYQRKDSDWCLHADSENSRGKRDSLSEQLDNSSSGTEQWDQSVSDYIHQILATSSVGGVNKVFLSKTFIQKVIWALVLTACVVGFLYQLYEFAVIYKDKPSVVQLEVENNGLAELPAVTLCNTNRVRKSEYCNIKPEECEDNPDNLTLSDAKIQDMMYDLLLERKAEQLHQLGHSADIIQSCIFNGEPNVEEEECSQMLENSYDPDYGNCYTIPPRNTKGQILKVAESDFWNEANDLSLLLDVESEEFLEGNRRPGIVVTIHDNFSSPDIHTDGFKISPGHSYSYAVKRTTVFLLPLPYKTNCTEYYNLPWQEKYDRRHTSRLCTVGCSQYYQLLKCKYVTRNVSLFYKELPYDPKTITKKDEMCAEMEELRTQNYCKTICGLPCRDVVLQTRGSNSELADTDFGDHNIHSRKNRSLEEKMKNLVLLKIYFSSLDHKIYRHIPKYGTMEVFSYLGGYSGVWLGFSILTLYELIEIIVCSLLFAFRKRQRANQHRKMLATIVNTKRHTHAMVKNFRRKHMHE